jgi:hypothetical protein
MTVALLFALFSICVWGFIELRRRRNAVPNLSEFLAGCRAQHIGTGPFVPRSRLPGKPR